MFHVAFLLTSILRPCQVQLRGQEDDGCVYSGAWKEAGTSRELEDVDGTELGGIGLSSKLTKNSGMVGRLERVATSTEGDAGVEVGQGLDSGDFCGQFKYKDLDNEKSRACTDLV